MATFNMKGNLLEMNASNNPKHQSDQSKAESDSEDDMFELTCKGYFDAKKQLSKDDVNSFSRSPQASLKQIEDDVMARSCSLKGLINTREALRLAGSMD
jgi:hypothetical protein